jgi:diaminopimelate epimerase
VRFLKGHGTENDFVLLPDPDGSLVLTSELVQRLCDRRAGIGADGVLRVVPTAKEPDGAPYVGDAPWFMDYRNADGSIAEMCGNGVRVYARYLVTEGLVEPGPLRLATRGGVKDVVVEGDLITVDMGLAVVEEPLTIDGMPATAIDMGNPHAVVHVASVDALGTLHPERTDLNVEFVRPLGSGHIRLRVHERGVGETRSCGTGAAAAALATRFWAGEGAPDVWTVDVPGGRLRVTALPGHEVELAGPAVLVADGLTTLV